MALPEAAAGDKRPLELTWESLCCCDVQSFRIPREASVKRHKFPSSKGIPQELPFPVGWISPSMLLAAAHHLDKSTPEDSSQAAAGTAISVKMGNGSRERRNEWEEGGYNKPTSSQLHFDEVFLQECFIKKG